MTEDQQALLLTTARILRAHLREYYDHTSNGRQDAADLHDALRPFESNVIALRSDGASAPLKHDFVPHKKFSWCDACGYPRDEPLKHNP